MERKSLIVSAATMPRGRFFELKNELSPVLAATNFLLAYLPVNTLFWRFENGVFIGVVNWRLEVKLAVRKLSGEGFIEVIGFKKI